MSKKRQKRSFKEWKKPDSTEKRPEIKVVASSPDTKVSQIIERDQRFDEIAASGEIDLSTIAYTLVKRMGPGSEQLRMPLTEEMAQSWLDFVAGSERIEQSKWTEE